MKLINLPTNLPKFSYLLFFALAFLSFGIYFWLKNQESVSKGKPGSSVSPDILFLTSPITSLSSGKIVKVEGSIIWVSQKYTFQNLKAKTITPSPYQPFIPQTITKEITFKVTIGPNTQITRPETNIPYLLKTTTPSSTPKLTIKDLKVGQMINSISTNNVDLRTLSKPEFEASSINLPPLQNTLSGKIEKISGNTIILKAFPPQAETPEPESTPASPQERQYIITVTSATEISRHPPSTGQEDMSQPVKPEKLSLSDLTPNINITVYTDVDVTTVSKFTALLINAPQIARDITPTQPPPPPTTPPLETEFPPSPPSATSSTEEAQ